MVMASHTLQLPKYGRIKPGRAGAERIFWDPGPGLRRLGYTMHRLYRPDGLPVPVHQIGLAIELLTHINARVAAGAEPSEIARIAAGKTAIVELAEPPTGAPSPGTLYDVIRRYKAHWRFRELRQSTRRVYGQSLEFIGAWAGDKHVTVIDRPLVQELYATLRGQPYKAKHIMAVLRILLEFASRDLGLIQQGRNAAAKAGIKTPRLKTRPIWSPEQVAHMDATARRMGYPSYGLALAIDHWAVQRIGDLIRIPRTAYRNGEITVNEQSKTRDSAVTGGFCICPIDLVPGMQQRIAAYLDNLDTRAAIATTLIVNETTGRPYTERQFSDRHREIREEAAKTMPDCAELQFKFMRHTGITGYKNAGVDNGLIASISGHDIGTFDEQEVIMGTYIVKTREQAIAAVRQRLAYEQGLREQARVDR